MNRKIIFFKLALFIAGFGPHVFCMAEDILDEEQDYLEKSQNPDIRTYEQIRTEPTRITRTEERQQETILIDHYLERHVWPSVDGEAPIYHDKYSVKRTP